MGLFRNISFLVIAAGLCFAGSVHVAGQSPYDPSMVPEAFLIRDHLELYCDRSVYVVGESILFRADYRVEGVTEGKTWSTILYAELITPDGRALSRGKFSLAEGMGSGRLRIPAGAVAGNYYLKCYTRWMRNSGPFSFSYVPLKIVNPFKSEVADHNGGNGLHPEASRRDYMEGYLDCSPLKPVYGRGEQVTFSIRESALKNPGKISCCVTVVPLGAIDLDQGQLIFPGSPLEPGEYSVNYLPDLKGVSLSGTMVRSGQVDHPIGSARIYFSLLGESPDYFAAVTDDQGRFMVSAPSRPGGHELFIAPDPGIVGEAEVKIDQEFDSGNLPLPEEGFQLTGKEHEVATVMALRSQLSSVYEPKGSPAEAAEEPVARDSILYFGSPGFTLRMDDFVTLPTLEEVFINLVPEVIVETKRGRKSLRFNGPNHAIGLYTPLILMDLIPVFDQEKLLVINPERILKIELVNEVYVKGDVSHGGIISITSRNGDMAGIDLPVGSYFFDFQSVQAPFREKEPIHSPGDRVPDMRNTLLWLDELTLEGRSEREISFKAPSTPGEYVILVRGLLHQGHVISARAHFSVE